MENEPNTPQSVVSSCEVCGGHIEHPPELMWREIICPHCDAATKLGMPPRAGASYGQPSSEQMIPRAKVKRRGEFVGSGCFLQGIGVILLFLFPLGTVIGIILILWGGRLAIKYECGACGNRVDGRHVKICPVCKTRLG